MKILICGILSLALFCKSWAATLDFVETPLAEVMRAVSLAYNVPILVDDQLNFKVTFHLENVGFMEAVTSICNAHGLEFVEESKVFHVRRAKVRGVHEFKSNEDLISIDVKDKEVNEFIREFAANSGLNILGDVGLTGNVSGTLKNMIPEDCFRAIMEACNYRVYKEKDILRVSAKKKFEKSEDKIQVVKDGDLYSVEIKEGELYKVLEEIAELVPLNLAVYGDIRENLKLKFNKVSLEYLIDALFKGKRYSYALDSATLFVSEGGAKNALSSSKLYPLKHINSEKALEYFNKFAPSENFLATLVKEQNAILFGGTPFEIQMAEDVLKQIDVPGLQVNLSCIIVEFKKGRGFEWGIHSGNPRKTAEHDIGFRGYFDFLNKDFAKVGKFGKIGLLPDRFELELASMEENNTAEILARPKLTTLNGNKAELNVTNTVYYLVSQVSADGYPITDYRSFNDGISLEITPSVTQEGSITLEVSPEIKTAGRSTGDGPRDISTRNLKTVVVLKDGETLCLGGLIRKSKSEVKSAVPFLGSLPIIGRFFSYNSEEDEENELAIFITPQVEKAKMGD